MKIKKQGPSLVEVAGNISKTEKLNSQDPEFFRIKSPSQNLNLNGS